MVAIADRIPPRAGSAELLLVDDHALMRAGLRRMLETHAGIGRIREADRVEAALEQLRRGRVDLVLMDLGLPGLSGPSAIERLRRAHADVPVLVVSGRVETALVRRAIASGASGYVSKNADSGELRAAVDRVLAGRAYWCAESSTCIADGGRDTIEDPFEALSARERDIVDALLEGGLRNREIARRLHLSEKTVSTYRVRAFEKLGVDTATDLIRLAMRHGHWRECDD